MPFPQFAISDFPREAPLAALKSCYQIVANGSILEHRDEFVLASTNVVLYAYGLTSKPLVGAAADAADQVAIETAEQFLEHAGHAVLVADGAVGGQMAGAIPWGPLAAFLLRMLLEN